VLMLSQQLCILGTCLLCFLGTCHASTVLLHLAERLESPGTSYEDEPKYRQTSTTAIRVAFIDTRVQNLLQPMLLTR
jgi:hypothetical protein